MSDGKHEMGAPHESLSNYYMEYEESLLNVHVYSDQYGCLKCKE